MPLSHLTGPSIDAGVSLSNQFSGKLRHMALVAEGRSISKSFFQEVCISLYSGAKESHQSHLHMVEPEGKGEGVGGVSVADFYRSVG